jgi:toxin secretion/phage lysis holin
MNQNKRTEWYNYYQRPNALFRVKAMVVWKWAIAAVIAFWVGLPIAIHLLLILMAFDFATGIMASAIQKQLDPNVGWRGLGKKCMTLMLVAVCHLIVNPLNIGIDLGAGVAFAYSANEVISIIENCARSGVPIPDILLSTLAKFKTIKFSQGQQAVDRLKEQQQQ